MKFVSKVSQSIYPSLYTVSVLVVFQLTIFSFFKSKHVSMVESVVKNFMGIGALVCLHYWIHWFVFSKSMIVSLVERLVKNLWALAHLLLYITIYILNLALTPWSLNDRPTGSGAFALTFLPPTPLLIPCVSPPWHPLIILPWATLLVARSLPIWCHMFLLIESPRVPVLVLNP